MANLLSKEMILRKLRVPYAKGNGVRSENKFLSIKLEILVLYAIYILLISNYFFKYRLFVGISIILYIIIQTITVVLKAKLTGAQIVGAFLLLQMFITGLASGAILPADLLNRDFWEGEGRIYISILLYIFSSFPLLSRRSVRKIIMVLFMISTITLLLVILWIVSNGNFFSSNKYFVGYFTSHVGAGVYYSLLGTFLLIYGYTLHRYGYFILGILMIAVGIFAAATRSSLFGLLVLLTYYLFKKYCITFLRLLTAREARISVSSRNIVLSAVTAIFIITMTVIIVFFITSPTGDVKSNQATGLIDSVQRVSKSFQVDTLIAFKSGIRDSENFASGHVSRSGFSSDYWNIYARGALWATAISEFATSPLVGIGFARFNDKGKLYCKLGIGDINIGSFACDASERVFPVEIEFDDDGTISALGNAHNQFLQLLAEDGILGFTTFLLLIFSVSIKLKSSINSPDLEARAIAQGTLAGFIYLLATSFYGSYLFAPSVSLTFAVLIHIAYSTSTSMPDRQESMTRGV